MEKTQAAAAPAPARRTTPPQIGDTVLVQARPGVLLINNETGGFLPTDSPMPQTVTVTLLRRLADGDVELVG